MLLLLLLGRKWSSSSSTCHAVILARFLISQPTPPSLLIVLPLGAASWLTACVCDGRITPTQSIDSTRSQFATTRISCLLGLQLELELELGLGLTACVSYGPSILANKAETNLLAVPGLNLHKWPERRG